MTRQFTFAETLRAMADDCQSGQRTGKSDRWALTLRDAATALEQAERERDAALAELRAVRECLWLHHGCPSHAAYGDDGEMQCNATTRHRPLDFKRESIPDLVSTTFSGVFVEQGRIEQQRDEQAWTALRDNLDIADDKAQMLVRLAHERDTALARAEEAEQHLACFVGTSGESLEAHIVRLTRVLRRVEQWVGEQRYTDPQPAPPGLLADIAALLAAGEGQP